MVNQAKTLLTIGSNIRKKRMLLQLTQGQLAYEAGVTREFINKIESGKYNLSVITLMKIAEILEVNVIELFTKLSPPKSGSAIKTNPPG